MSAGTTIPPKAAPKGSTALLKLDNSPVSSSRFISIPASKKKMAIRKSLIHFKPECGSGIVSPKWISLFHNPLYASPLDELDTINETAVQTSNKIPVNLLSEIKILIGSIAFLMNFVKPSYLKFSESAPKERLRKLWLTNQHNREHPFLEYQGLLFLPLQLT